MIGAFARVLHECAVEDQLARDRIALGLPTDAHAV
jgi:hypothetical protein